LDASGSGAADSGVLILDAMTPDAAPDAMHYEPLWNGVDLEGWDGDPDVWRVENGAIVGNIASDAGSSTTYLVHRGEFGDFALSGEVWLESGGNSGVQYRSTENARVGFRAIKGYQFDLGINVWGAIYDQGGGRGDLVAPPPACRKSGQFDAWNTFEIVARGRLLVQSLNGLECARFEDTSDAGRTTGLIAFQYHHPGGYEVRFRALRIAAL
jgi:hypothetical protein